MVSTIEVREADDSDRDVLMGFHQGLYHDHRDEVVAKKDLPLIEYRDYERILRDDLDALLRDRNSHVLVAESQGVAVGYITGRVTMEPRRVLPRRGVVEDWYVLPESRGLGGGRCAASGARGAVCGSRLRADRVGDVVRERGSETRA